MLLKIFLYKLFFFISLIYCTTSFGMSFKQVYKKPLIKNQQHLNVYSNQKNKKTLFFFNKNQFFSFLKLKKNFIKKNTFNISNENFFAIFEKDRFKIFYVVKLKDTLYSIAKKSIYNFYELSKFNLIKKPYKIMVGQKIWIGDFLIHQNKNCCFVVNSNKHNKKYYTPCKKIFNKTFKVSKFVKNYIQYRNSQICFFCNNTIEEKHSVFEKKHFDSSQKWYLPIKGENIKYKYHDTSRNKEIEFFGFKGQPVFASAAGIVVCITDVFKKYGRLIILKHDQNYLSIYAFNDLILVKPREKVHINQQISTMGLSEKKIAQLYFEIRYRGESINPLNILFKNDIK